MSNSNSTEKVERTKLKSGLSTHTAKNNFIKFAKNVPDKKMNQSNQSQTDDLINNRIKRKKERESKSLKNKLKKSTMTFSNNSRKENSNNDNNSVIYHNINSGQYTTNIHNNLNININTQNLPAHNTLGSPQLKRTIVSFGQIPSNQLHSNRNKNKTKDNYLFKTLDHSNKAGNHTYMESMKNFFENRSILKLKEELLEARLKIEKLQNENQLLQEKKKTSKSMAGFYEQKIEMLKKHYQETIDGYKKEIDRLRKSEKNNNVKINKTHQRTESRISNSVDTKAQKEGNSSDKKQSEEEDKKFEEKYKQNEAYLVSTLNILIDIIELFIFQKIPYTARDSYLKTNTDNISYSIDIYDSYNNDDERRNTLIEQIQSIVISKLKFLNIVLGVNLEKEITKVRNWNNLMNKDSNNNLSISLNNLSQVKGSVKKDQNIKEKDAQSFTSSDQNSSNIFQTSPKFYRNISFDSLKENNDSKLRVFEMAKDENYSVRLNSSAQNDSLDFINEGQSYTSFQDINSTNKAFNMISSFGNFNMNIDFNPKFGNNNDSNLIFNSSVKDIPGMGSKEYNSGNNTIGLANSITNMILGDIKIAEPEYIAPISNIESNQNKEVTSSTSNTLVVNSGLSTNSPNEIIKAENEISIDKNNLDNNNVKPNDSNLNEAQLKFTSTFKKLSIDLNDEPTEFNIEEICVGGNKNENKEEEEKEAPVILSPIVRKNNFKI